MKPLTFATIFLLSVALAACTPPQPGTTQPAIEPTSTVVRETDEEADVRKMQEQVKCSRAPQQ